MDEEQDDPKAAERARADASPRERRLALMRRLRERFSLPGLEAWSTSTRTVFINALFLLAVIVVFPVLLAQFRRNEVVIEPIGMPQAMVEQGLTPEVAASRVWDGIQDVKARAATSKESIDAIPSARQVEFSFPDSGFSVESLVFHIRRLFGAYETRIGGEFTCAEPTCERGAARLRLRVIRDRIDIVDLPPIGRTPEREYFEQAAAGAYSVLDPFVAMAAIARTQPVTATTLAYRLIRSGHRDAKWAYNMIGGIHADEGELATAITEFRAAIALDGSFVPAHANLGNALLRTGDLDGAQRELEWVRRRDPANVPMLQGLSDLALARGDVPGAVAQLLKAADARPADPQFFAKAGKIELDHGDKAKGGALLKQSLELDPSYLPAFAFLAAPYVVEGNYVAAEKIYRNAADFSPENAAAQAEHANILALLHQWDKARDRYGHAMELDPKNAGYAVNYAKCLQALGRNEEALAPLEAARQLEPANAETFMALGDAFRGLDRKADALAAYRKVLELDRDASSINRRIAEAWISQLSG